MNTAYEYVVVGCGGLGSAAAYRLAREAGNEILALEQFRFGHDHGASQDHSRIIRLSYHDPIYTALTPHPFTAWRDVEEASGIPLVVKTGGLDLAAPGCDSMLNYAAAMTVAGFPYEDLAADEAMRRWPQWRLRQGDRVLNQPDAGLVDAGKAIATHLALARAHGATVRDHTPVRAIRPTASGVDVGGEVVTTETRTFEKNPVAYERVVTFLEERLPGYTGPELYTKTCLYTMPPDRNFIIDFVPGYPQNLNGPPQAWRADGDRLRRRDSSLSSCASLHESYTEPSRGGITRDTVPIS